MLLNDQVARGLPVASGLLEEVAHGDLRRVSELLDRRSACIVDHSSNPEEPCLKCGVYFRERCPVRQLPKRNCFY
jgi:hypothetical protein